MSWYPGSIFEIEDRSAITEIPVSEKLLKPTVLLACSTDKGPENIVKISGKRFLDQFITGTPSFAKHGQALLNAVNIISSGGELVFKRIVANDATLANIAVFGNVIVEQATRGTLQKVDDQGRPLYKNPSNSTETVDPTTPAVGEGDPTPNDPVMSESSTRVSVFYSTKTYKNKKNVNEIVSEMKNEAFITTDEGKVISDEDDTVTKTRYTVPLFVITDIGRGISAKRFQIVPDFESSKTSTYCKFNIVVSEGDATLEKILFTMNPEIVLNSNNLSIESVIKRDSDQLGCKMFANNIISFYEILARYIYSEEGFDATDGKVSDEALAAMLNHDIITLKTKKKIPLDSAKSGITGVPELKAITVDGTATTGIYGTGVTGPEVVDLTNAYGIALVSGTDGSSTTLTEEGVIVEKERCEQLVSFFTGGENHEYDDIYDVDLFKIDYCLDADYPCPVKRAIEHLAKFREDFYFFEDFGTGKEDIEFEETIGETTKKVEAKYYLGPISTYDAIENIVEQTDEDLVPVRSRYVGWYHNYWDVFDPYSKKQITVSVTYQISKKIIQHHIEGLSRPFAGILYNIVFDDVIEGTINYIPRIVPDKKAGEVLNRKSDMCDLRVNYCSYIDNQLVLETLYTSQELYSQLSFSNNIILVQAVIKAIRSRCPQIRYQFMEGEDLDKYKEDVQGVINQYATLFRNIEFEYVADPLYESNKIFYAVLKVTFKNFIQTEYFKIIALPS